MLSECESRVLAVSMEALIKDFEPKEAIPYMESEDIFNEDHVEAISNLERRSVRVQEFLRIYRQKAPDLEPLLDFFKGNKQPHLANIIRRNRETKPVDRPLLSKECFTLRLLESGIPIRPRHYVERKTLLSSLKKSLIDLANEDQFWLVIHGMAGSGKTCLASEVIASDPELLSRYFEHVLWFSGDSYDTTEGLPSLYANFFTTIADPIVLTGRESATHLHSQARMFLLEKPNALIVLDNVIFEECVRWFDQLRCRILATSRNIDIFQAASGKVLSFPMKPSGFTFPELTRFLSSACSPGRLPVFTARKLINVLHFGTEGLPALINIMVMLSRNDHERLEWLCGRLDKEPLNSLDCVTSYRFSNLEIPIGQSFAALSYTQKDILCSLAIFPTDAWIPVQVIDLIAPVDVAGPEDSVFATLEILEKLAQRSMIEEREVKEGNGCPYEYRVHPVMGNFLQRSVENEHLHRIRLLVSRIEDFLESSARRHGHERVHSFYRSYESWLKNKTACVEELRSVISSDVDSEPVGCQKSEKKRLRDSCMFM